MIIWWFGKWQRLFWVTLIFYKKPVYKKLGLQRSKHQETVGLHCFNPKKLGIWNSKKFHSPSLTPSLGFLWNRKFECHSPRQESHFNFWAPKRRPFRNLDQEQKYIQKYSPVYQYSVPVLVAILLMILIMQTLRNILEVYPTLYHCVFC